LTPTARTLAHLRRLGFLAARVEVYLPAVRRHRDLFGVADVLAVHPRDRQLLLVQATSAPHVPDRLRRVRARPELPGLLRAGVGVEVWGWARRRGRWHVRRVALRAEDLAGVEVAPLPRRRARKGERQRELFG
jgi:hypothetical protein